MHTMVRFAVVLALCIAVHCYPSGRVGTWYTKADANGAFKYHNDAWSSNGIQLKGISMTGMETGSRGTPSGGGYWLFDPGQGGGSESMNIIKTLITTLKKEWGATVLRLPICGSAWLQNYNVQDWSHNKIASYQDWVDDAINTATENGMVAVLDNHLWAIARQTSTTRNQGPEDGCTGINKVCVGLPQCLDSCAPHDWYGHYTSQRTGKTYNEGDDVNNWECAIANADGCSLDNVKRGNNAEHFLNLWYDLAGHFKGNSFVFFELFNEPYQRKAAHFDDPACKQQGPGTAFNCPPGTGFGDNLDESAYDWKFWTMLNNITIHIIREQGADNIIQVSGLDWNYDYLAPIANPAEMMPWTKWAKNIGYSLHPYQHGACCGEIGADSDQSATDPYESAMCLYPPSDKPSGSALPISSSVPAGSKVCDTTGYATTQDKKSPPCVWVATGKKSDGSTGVCAGERGICGHMTQQQCTTAHANWTSPQYGGWSRYVLPLQKYGPLMATEFGSFDCSSAFTKYFLQWAKETTTSYTAWALWPQNSGGPGAGACGYPSVLMPAGGALDNSCAYGKCDPNCKSESSCATLLKPLPWSGTLIYNDMKGGGPGPNPSPSKCTTGLCNDDSDCTSGCKCNNNECADK